MSAGIVDQFELIQIQVQQGMAGACVLGILDRHGETILEFTAVDQSGQRIVAGLVVQRAMQAALLAHVVKHHDRADEIAGAIADRRRRILDGEFLTAAVDDHGVLGELLDAVFDGLEHRREQCAPRHVQRCGPVVRAQRKPVHVP